MTKTAIARSPTTDRLHSFRKTKNVRFSGKPINFTHSSWKPMNNSRTLWEPRHSSHTLQEPHTPEKTNSYTHTSCEPTNNPHTLWEPRNSTHPPCESHSSGKPNSHDHMPWRPTNNPHTLQELRNSSHPPWESHTSEKPRSYTHTSWEPENSTGISGKPRSVPDLNPLTTPTKETDQQKEDSASIQEIRHSSERRESLGNVEMPRKDHLHQEKNAERSLKMKIRLDVLSEKENHNRCIEESTGIAVTAKAKGLGENEKLSLDKRSCLKCYTCGKFVKDVHFEEHLFFGESVCTRCNWKTSSCEAFRETKMDQINGNSTCLHDLRYCLTPSEYISNKISQESPLELDKSKLHSYVCSLKRLKVSEPWKKAIDQCVKFLKGETSQPCEKNEHLNVLETVYSLPEQSVPTSKHEVKSSPSLRHENGDSILSQSYDLEDFNNVVEYEIARDYPEVRIARSPALFTESSGECTNMSHTNIDTCSTSCVRDVSSLNTSLSDMVGIDGSMNLTQSQEGPRKIKPKPGKRSKSKPGFTRLQAKQYTEKSIIETPSNGYYLIVRHAIEECPMCYTEFCPSRFTVNINTFLLTTVCIGCDLTVYIVVDPPEGIAPRIFIETESDLPKKQKKYAAKRKKSRHKGRPRVKDFFKS